MWEKIIQYAEKNHEHPDVTQRDQFYKEACREIGFDDEAELRKAIDRAKLREAAKQK